MTFESSKKTIIMKLNNTSKKSLILKGMDRLCFFFLNMKD